MTDADGSDTAASSTDRMDPDGVARQRPAYTESQVIMTTVKVIVPFVLTYGLFTVFHGADSPGGGFQGGAIIAAVVLMIAFAFGIDATREWISNVALVGLATLGVAIFGGIALGSVALGGAFLEYPGYGALEPIIALKPYEWTKWGMEAVEIGGIAFIVAGVLMGLFFLLAAGYDPNGNDDTERDRDVDRPASEVHRNE